MRFFLGDTETTGFKPPAAAICEVCWYELDEQAQVIRVVHSLIDPEHPIPAACSAVHHITDDMVADKPTIQELFDLVLTIEEHPGDDEICLIAHNSPFDAQFLAPHMNLAAQLDTLRLSRKLWPEADNHKLTTLAYHIPLQKGKEHSADGDVFMLHDLLLKVIEKSGKALLELVAAANEPVEVQSLPFGKHRGVPLKDVPLDYIQWALENMDKLDKDQRYSLQIQLQRRA